MLIADSPFLFAVLTFIIADSLNLIAVSSFLFAAPSVYLQFQPIYLHLSFYLILYSINKTPQ
ncbi:hypothetical protein CN514_10005 [Bacillus sp. AFS001701]|uniref:hypothetical protein n=1 Tax=Bacillus sp. AFS001701 TaxID=2033480 RepID=UPI000BF6C243|nr:hypothetical protein [Bacillus sp. AFS001701]PET68507.1 hypothetical protein CN514_10005 [Bacillus sp. AFS001701]